MTNSSKNPKEWCPPKRTYAEIHSHYLANCAAMYATELHWFEGQNSLKMAVARAAVARSRKGKRLSHQRCVSRFALRSAHDILTKNLGLIKSCTSFVELHDLVGTLTFPIKGIGPLYVYDAALRIGAHMTSGASHLPKEVYLHAGSLLGAVEIQHLKSIIPNKVAIVKTSIFPAPLNSLDACELENLLCLYRRCLC
jgi:hypothetical protein